MPHSHLIAGLTKNDCVCPTEDFRTQRRPSYSNGKSTTYLSVLSHASLSFNAGIKRFVIQILAYFHKLNFQIINNE